MIQTSITQKRSRRSRALVKVLTKSKSPACTSRGVPAVELDVSRIKSCKSWELLMISCCQYQRAASYERDALNHRRGKRLLPLQDTTSTRVRLALPIRLPMESVFIKRHYRPRHFYATLEDAFLANVDVRGLDECWPWRGATNDSGYGTLKYHSVHWNSHQLAYELFHGPRCGLYVLHACDNRVCCNPCHLSIGTQSQNLKEAVVRGRISSLILSKMERKL